MASRLLITRSFFVLGYSLCCFAVFSQARFVPDSNYLKHTADAFNLQVKGMFKEAALAYDSAFIISGGKAKPLDLYNAAFAWIALGNKNRAFDHLEKAVFEYGFDDIEKLQREGELFGLSKDNRWDKLLQTVKKNKEQREAKLDKDLVEKLKLVFHEDQQLRLQLDSVQKKFGFDSKETGELWKVINYKDSQNLVVVKEIIDTKGWLGDDELGDQGNTTLFLVIQHADSATQEKYLPVLLQAVKEGKAKPHQLALLEDRTRTNKGQKQIYGSQVFQDPSTNKLIFFPIEDEINVNKRRASIGLGPLEEYAKLFGIEYRLPLR
jgi:hypothetical protein